MLDLLKEYWDMLAALLLGVLWIGRVSQRVSDLEKREAPMTEKACQRQQADCQKVTGVQLAHGQREFDEIKQLISELKKSQEEREARIIQLILDQRGGK